MFSQGGLANPDTGYQRGGTERISTRTGTTVTDEDALKISAVWACVQMIAMSVTNMPLNFQRMDKEGNRGHMKSRAPITDLMLVSPNRYMKPRDFRSAMTVQMALWNNAYAEIAWSNERPVALTPLKPGRMTPMIDANGDLSYHYQTDKGVKVYAQRSILHLKGITTEGIIALERNNFGRESYGLSSAADTFAAKQFGNGGRPGGVLEYDEFLKPRQREELKNVYSKISEGAVNANELWVLEGGMKYSALDFAADQMQMIATRMHQLGEVARFFGVPDVLIGAASNGSSAWPASFEQQMLAFLTFTLQSYTEEWEAALKDALLPKDSDIVINHDPSTLIQMDSQAKANYWSRMVQNGLATRNEARKANGLPPSDDDGANKLTVQSNLTPLDLLEEIGHVPKSSESDSSMQTEVRQ
jgi:HK97 family phage portal protein